MYIYIYIYIYIYNIYIYISKVALTMPVSSCGCIWCLVSALVLSRVDYCNSSLAGLLAVALAPLQGVLNAATWYVADLRLRDHMTSVQRSLHWLPHHQRIEYRRNLSWCTWLSMGLLPTTSGIRWSKRQLCLAAHISDLLAVRECTRMGDRVTSVLMSMDMEQTSIGHSPID